MKIIGIVGQPSSGKDTVANYISKKLNIQHVSGGDFIRAKMKEEGLPLDRSSINNFVSTMRKKVGMAYPYNEIIPSVKADTIFSGMRNVAEIKALKDGFGDDFVLISVETPQEVRYRFARARGRIGDGISFEKFQEEEVAERNNLSGTHQVDLVVKMANFEIENLGTEDDLYKKVDEILQKIKLLQA